MKTRKLFLALSSLLIGLAGIAAGHGALAQETLTLDKPLYIVVEGSTGEGRLTFLGGGQGTNTFGGQVRLFHNNPGISRLSSGEPTVFPLTQTNPNGNTFVDFIFTLNGIAGGSTTLIAQAYDRFGTRFLEATSPVFVLACPVAVSLAGEVDEDSMLSLLHAFRDEVMSRTALGQQYVDIFYDHAAEATLLLFRDKGLRDRSLDLLRRVKPALAAAVNGKRGWLGTWKLGRIDKLLGEIASKGSGDLADAAEQLRADLPALLADFGIRTP